MTDVNKVAEPSAASLERIQYDNWDEHGTPIVSKPPEEPKQTEEPAASDAPKAADSEPKGKSAAEAEAAPKQEEKERKPGEKLSAEERIGQLTAKVKTLEQHLAEKARPIETKPPAETKAQPPRNYEEWRKSFKPKEWVLKYGEEHKDASYEDAVAAMNDLMDEVRTGYRRDEEARTALRREMDAQVEAVEKRYPNARETLRVTAAKLLGDERIYPGIRSMIGSSPVAADLVYVLSDEKALSDFVNTAIRNPDAAIRKLVVLEQQIQAELAKPAATETVPEEKPKAEPKPPAESKPRAPRPPSEVGGRAAGADDSLVSAARANDFRAFDAEQTRRKFASR